MKDIPVFTTEFGIAGLRRVNDDFLRDAAGIAGQQIDAVGEQNGLVDVVGDEQRGQPDLLHHIQKPAVDGTFGQGI